MAAAAGVSLLSGVFTPMAAAVIALGNLIALAQETWAERLPVIFLIMVSAAIICVGPGAYSIDARLFGRREIIIPLRSPSQKSCGDPLRAERGQAF